MLSTWKNKLVLVFVGVNLLLPTLVCAESVTFQGRVSDASGNPLTGAATLFRVQILSPNANRCVLYDETHTVNLAASYGLFSINLNDGNGTRSLPTTYSLDQAISNRTGFSVDASYCAGGGSGTVTYSPVPGDNRKVVIQFRDPVKMGSTWETIPEMDLNPVPYAIETRTLGGFPASSVVRVQDAGNPSPAPILTTGQVTELQSLINGSSNNYMSSTAGSTTGARMPTVSGRPSTPGVGSIWYDTITGTVKYFNGSADQTLGVGSASGGTITTVNPGTGIATSVAGSAVTVALSPSGVGAAGTVGSASAVPEIEFDTYGRIVRVDSHPISGLLPAAGVDHQVLKSSGGAWGADFIGKADLRVSAGQELFPGTCNVNQTINFDSVAGRFVCQDLGGITSAQLAAASGTAVGTYRSVSINAAGQVVAGTNPTTLAGYAISDGVQNGGSVPRIRSGAADPSGAGVDGELYVATTSQKIFRYNLGTATWETMASAGGAGGTVTGITGGAGIAVSGSATTPTVGLSTAGVTAGTFAKVTTDAYGRVTSGSAQVGDADIADVAFSKVSGKPTTLAGYGITDALVGNAGGAASLQAGPTGSRPSPGSAGQIYIDTDTNTVYYRGASAWQTVASAAGSGGTLTEVHSGAGVNVTGTGTTRTVALTDVGTASTGLVKVNTDAKGRVTSGATSLGDAEINDLAFAKLTGKPTTLAGHGITEALVRNAGSAGSIQAGNSAGRPTVGTAGRIYIDTQANVVYFDNGTSWQTVSSAAGSGGTLTDVLSGAGVSVTGTGATRTVALPDVGATSTGLVKVNTDAKGRVTGGATTIGNAEISDLAFSKLTATPTTVGGYGITDAVKNTDGTVPNILSGNDAAKPAPVVGNLNFLYIAVDTQRIYRQTSGAWQVIGAATTTGFSGSLAGEVSGTQGATQVDQIGSFLRATILSLLTSVQNATDMKTNGAIVKRDGAGGFAAGAVTADTIVLKGTTSGTATLRAPATVTTYDVQLPAAAPSAGQVLSATSGTALTWTTPLSGSTINVAAPITNTSGTIGINTANGSQAGALSSTDWTTFNNKLSTALTAASIWVGNASNVATAVAPSGDVAMTNAGAFTVNGIRGQSISAAGATAGQVLRYAGSNTWTPNFVGIRDLRSNITGSVALSATCTASQTLTWDSAGDNLTCQNISIAAASQVTGVLPIANGGTGASTVTGPLVFAGPASGTAAPSFRALAASDLSGLANQWSETSGNLYRPTGNVGIGTASPGKLLELRQSTAAGSAIDSAVMLRLMNSDNAGTLATPSVAGIGFGYSSTRQAIVGGTYGNDFLDFYTGGALTSPRVRIDSTGNVGIGTAAPAVPLHVNGNIAIPVGVANGAFGVMRGATFVPVLWKDTAATDVVTLSNGNNNDITFATGNTQVEKMRIMNNGNVGIGTSVPSNYLEVASTSSSGYPLTLSQYENGSSGSGGILGRHARGTPSAPTAALSGDRLGGMWMAGHNGTAWGANSTAIISYAAENFTTAAAGTLLTFETTPVGSVTRQERLRIDPAGNVGIGTFNPTVSLDVGTRTDALRVPSGSSAQQPGQASMPMAANGMIRYNTTSSALEAYVNGAWANVATIGGASSFTTVNAGAGSATNPSHSFSGDSNTGFYNANSDDKISVATGGAKIFDFSSSGLISPTTGGAAVSSANGTASTPTYGFAGEAGLGWYRPTTATLAASTGSTERMRIDSNGFVGIGTSSPGHPLDVFGGYVRSRSEGTYGGFVSQTFASAAGTSSELVLSKARGTIASPSHPLSGDTIGSLVFRNGVIGQNAAYITSYAAENHGATATGGNLAFITTANTTTGSIERMRIENNGNVGIGSNSPNSKLDVFGNITNGGMDFYLGSSDQVGRGNSGMSRALVKDSGAILAVNYNGDFTGGTAIRGVGTTNLFVSGAANGNVGIGTTNPLRKLVIANGNTSGGGVQTVVQIGEAGTSGGPLYLTHNAPIVSGNTYFSSGWKYGGGTNRPAYIRYGEGFDFQTSTAAVGAADAAVTDLTTKMYLSPAGRLGIGTTNPEGALHVVTAESQTNTPSTGIFMGRSGAGDYQLQLTQTGGIPHIDLSRGTNTDYDVRIASTANDTLAIATASAGQVVTVKGGSVGIGNANPLGKLNVNGNVYIDNYGFGGNPIISLAVGDTDTGLNSTADGQLDVYSNSVRTMSFRNNNVGIGTTAPTFPLDAHSNSTTAIYGITSAGGQHGVLGETTDSSSAGVMGRNGATNAYGYLGNGGWGVNCAGGNCGGNQAWSNYSDARLKTEVYPVASALEKVMKLRGVTYRWIDKKRDAKEGQKLGLIAQEVEKVFPQSISTDTTTSKLPGGTKMIAYTDLVGPIVEAIKEFYAKWEADHVKTEGHERAIASLKTENEKIRAEAKIAREANQKLENDMKAMKAYLCAKDPSAPLCPKK